MAKFSFGTGSEQSKLFWLVSVGHLTYYCNKVLPVSVSQQPDDLEGLAVPRSEACWEA